MDLENGSSSAATGPVDTYHVRWETGDSGYVGIDDIEGMALPVDDATGLHMCVRVTESGLDRSGEVGIVVKATSLRVHVRFAAELLPSGEMARPRVQLNRYMTARHVKERWQPLLVELATPRAEMAVSDFLFELFTDVFRQEVVRRCPGREQEANLLSSVSALTDEAAASFHGRSFMAKWPDDAGDFKLYRGRVTGTSRDAAGRVSFACRFDDGDAVSYTADELLVKLTWERLPGIQRLLHSHGAAGSPRRRRPIGYAIPPSPSMNDDEGEATRALAGAVSTPRRDEDGPRSVDAPTQASAELSAGGGRLEGMARMRAIRALMDGDGARRPAMQGSPPPVSVPVSAMRSSRPYMPRQRRAVYEEIKQMVMADQDMRAKAEFSGAFPKARRDLARVKEFVRERHGAARQTRTNYAPRWDMLDYLTAEDAQSWLEAIDALASVKASTKASYDSTRRGYEEFVRRYPIPLVAYPLSVRSMGLWLGFRYHKGLMSNLNNTKPLLSALTHHCRHVLRIDLDARPYPGMAVDQRDAIGRVCRALAELEDMAVRRSIPLTALLLRMCITEGAVNPMPFSPAMSVPDMRALRDVARYSLNRTAMLRRDDCKGRKQCLRDYTSSNDPADPLGATLRVPPGKAHTVYCEAQVHGLGSGADGAPTDPSGTYADWLCPGYAMSEWLKCLRHLSGGTIENDALLFPSILDDGTRGTSLASLDAFQSTIRKWVRTVGLPDEFASRITLHGFRSGGCSDAINSGASVQYIMVQGRWTSHCFEMYIHLRTDVIRTTFREVTQHAAQTASERSASEHARTQRRLEELRGDMLRRRPRQERR